MAVESLNTCHLGSDRPRSHSVDTELFHRAVSRKKALMEYDETVQVQLPTIPDIILEQEELTDEEDPGPKAYPYRRWHSEHGRSPHNALAKAGLVNIRPSGEITVEEAIVSLDANGVSKPGVRRSSFESVLQAMNGQHQRILRLKNEQITVYPSQQSHKENISDRKRVQPQKQEISAVNNTPLNKTPSPIPSQDSFEYIDGLQASVGGSDVMTLSQKSDEIEGTETIFGSSRTMSPDQLVENLTANHHSHPLEQPKKRKRSVRDVFKMGLFLSKKNKKKSPAPPAGCQADDLAPPIDEVPRVRQRRMSRLEMNEPIEDIFAGVKFETIDRGSIPGDGGSLSTDDSDVDEDVDVIVMTSLLEKQCSTTSEDLSPTVDRFYGNDAIVQHDVTGYHNGFVRSDATYVDLT